MILLALLGACSTGKQKIIENNLESGIVDYGTLVNQAALFIKVRVVDELTENNSNQSDIGGSSDFYSIRTVDILDDFGSDIKINHIIVSEAILDGVVYKYADNRSLEKDGSYLIYLVESSTTDGYAIPNFEGAIINLDESFISSSPEVILSDFNSLLKASGDNTSEFEGAVYTPGIKELESSEQYNVTVCKNSVDYYVGSFESNNSILEINSMQYVVDNLD